MKKRLQTEEELAQEDRDAIAGGLGKPRRETYEEKHRRRYQFWPKQSQGVWLMWILGCLGIGICINVSPSEAYWLAIAIFVIWALGGFWFVPWVEGLRKEEERRKNEEENREQNDRWARYCEEADRGSENEEGQN